MVTIFWKKLNHQKLISCLDNFSHAAQKKIEVYKIEKLACRVCIIEGRLMWKKNEALINQTLKLITEIFLILENTLDISNILQFFFSPDHKNKHK